MVMSYGELFKEWEREGILQQGIPAKVFNPDQPRDDRGRWTDGNGGAETRAGDYEPVRHTLVDSNDERFQKKRNFVDAYLSDAEKGAKQLNVPVENILALSADESGWGKDKFPMAGNNFFGLQSPALYQTGSFPVTASSTTRGASFVDYSSSLQSFIATYGNLVQNVSDPARFARNLQDSGAFGMNPDIVIFDVPILWVYASLVKNSGGNYGPF